MKINEKFYKKYGTNSVILPPPTSLDEEIIEEVDPEAEELYNLPLKHDALPVIKEPSEKEMEHWEKWLSARNTQKDYDHGGSSGKDDSTIPPPGKSASAFDQLLKRCSLYYDLCCKLQTHDS